MANNNRKAARAARRIAQNRALAEAKANKQAISVHVEAEMDDEVQRIKEEAVELFAFHLAGFVNFCFTTGLGITGHAGLLWVQVHWPNALDAWQLEGLILLDHCIFGIGLLGLFCECAAHVNRKYVNPVIQAVAKAAGRQAS
jgi:hypothetical protein